jgi:protein phosphatase
MTDRGKEQTNNEDQFLVADLQKSMRVHFTSLGVDEQTRLFGGSQGKLFLVADGRGGHVSGKRASSLAVDCVVEYLLNTTQSLFCAHEEKSDDQVLCADLQAAFDHCRAKFTAEVEAMPERKGMGTTLTLAYVVWPRLYVAHVGDNRVYLLRGMQFEQITRDHTSPHAHLDYGRVTDLKSEASRISHTLQDAIRADSSSVRPEIHKAELQVGDKLLVCTDGLHQHVRDSQMWQMLQRDKPAVDHCRALIAAANNAEGSDNTTVIVAQFQDKTDVEAFSNAAAKSESENGMRGDKEADEADTPVAVTTQ